MRLKAVEEQVVVLMGASSGIGRETALRFAKRGAKVVVSARGEEGLDSLVEEIRREGGEAIAVPAETSQFEQVKAVADRAVEEYGRLDTWVHLAAVGLFATFEHTTPEEFGRVIDVNLMGQVYGAMAALPHLKREGRGALIHISSVEAKRSFPFHSAYGASKHGIDGFLEALRVELKHERWRVRVSQVMPGTINTPFFDKGRTKLGVKAVGVPPIYEPETVANIILYAAENPARDLVSGGGGPGPDPQPAPLPAPARRRAFDAGRLRAAEDRRAPLRARSGQPLRTDRRTRHGQKRLPGVVAEPLQLASDAPYAEASGGSRYSDGVVGCLARKVIEGARGRLQSKCVGEPDPIGQKEKLEAVWTRAGGIRMHARASGKPVPEGCTAVVLVHGFIVSSRYMIPTAERLAPHYRVFVPDPP